MRSRRFVFLALIASLSVACSNDDNGDMSNKTNSPQEIPQSTPVEYPRATGVWVEARTFMMRQEDETQGCAQIDFKVMANSGIFLVNECEATKTGQLTSAEFVRLDLVTTSAYRKTEGAVCPQIFRFGEYYATVNAVNDEFDRNFDPDSSCYRGSETAVNAYKTFLKQLVEKYSSGNVTD